MKDSKYSDEDIARQVELNPIRILENGNVLTCPVRLAFPQLSNPRAVVNEDGSTRELYSTSLLFPKQAGGMPEADPNGQIAKTLAPVWFKACEGSFASRKVGNTFPGLHCPFRDQGEKANYAGYEPGAVFINVNSQFKPQVVDNANNIIPEGPAFDARVYPGVWAVVTLTHYTFNNAKKKGATFGLSSVMILFEDDKLGGGKEDVTAAFSGIKLDRSFSPLNEFANAPTPEEAKPLIQPHGPVGAQPAVAAAPPPPPPSAPLPLAKEWPAAGGGMDPRDLIKAGWTVDNLLATGYEESDLVALGLM